MVAGVSTGLALAGLGLAYGLYRAKPAKATERDPLEGLGPLWAGMNRKWWVDELYGFLFIRPYVWLSRFLADTVDWRFWHDFVHNDIVKGGFNFLSRLTAEGIDLGFIDRLANGLAELSKGIAARFRRVETGYVRNYALGVFFGAILVLGVFLLVR